MKNEVIVIGNGESRKKIDLSLLSKSFFTVGCNAIHRDITVDHLVCCDSRMVREALENPDTKQSLIYVRDHWYHFFRKIKKNKNIRNLPDIPYTKISRIDMPEHWGSGAFALIIACSLGHKEITIIGFDLYGRQDRVNNIYKGTSNYAKETDVAVDYSYWRYQISKVFSSFPDINFKIVNHQDWPIPEEWKKNNVRFENIDNFILTINNILV